MAKNSWIWWYHRSKCLFTKSISTYIKRNLRTLNFSLFRRKCNFLYKYFKYYPLSPFISITCNECFVFILLMIAHRCNSTSYLKRTLQKYYDIEVLKRSRSGPHIQATKVTKKVESLEKAQSIPEQESHPFVLVQHSWKRLSTTAPTPPRRGSSLYRACWIAACFLVKPFHVKHYLRFVVEFHLQSIEDLYGV